MFHLRYRWKFVAPLSFHMFSSYIYGKINNVFSLGWYKHLLLLTTYNRTNHFVNLITNPGIVCRYKTKNSWRNGLPKLNQQTSQPTHQYMHLRFLSFLLREIRWINSSQTKVTRWKNPAILLPLSEYSPYGLTGIKNTLFQDMHKILTPTTTSPERNTVTPTTVKRLALYPVPCRSFAYF